MALAMEREPTAYSSLLMVAGRVLADREPMLSRLARDCIALAFTAPVPALHAATALLLIPSRGSEISYMALAMEREPNAYSSPLTLVEAVPADPEPMLSRLARDCIVLAFNAPVPALHAATALLIP